jgi:hypothetical protein
MHSFDVCLLREKSGSHGDDMLLLLLFGVACVQVLLLPLTPPVGRTVLCGTPTPP